MGRDAATLLLLAETDLGAGPAFSGSSRLPGRRRWRGPPDRAAGDRWRFELDARGIYYALGARGPVLRTRALQSVMLTPIVRAARSAPKPTAATRRPAAELAAYF